MRILIRTDASVKIGSGHLMRCLTLADQLVVSGAEVAFVCRDLPGAMFDLLSVRGFRFAKLPSVEDGCVSQQRDAAETTEAIGRLHSDRLDWLIVDHYLLDASWEQLLRPCTRKIMVIDDLADRRHDCELLLDQNYYHKQDQRYLGLVPEQCVTMLGPAYALLRPEFDIARQLPRVRDGSIKRILVFFGGSDHRSQTETVLKALELLNRADIFVDVVVGSSNPNRNSIQALCNRLSNVSYHCDISNMAELIFRSDLGVGAGGSAMWERCCLGLPTITVALAENQVETTEDVANLGAIKYLGWFYSLRIEDYTLALSELIANPKAVKRLSRAATGVLRTNNSTTVADAMQNLLHINGDEYPKNNSAPKIKIFPKII